MELRHLQSVVTLSETLHFGRAAERLYLTQSALSQQISRLEQELGVRLFERSSRHVRLTRAGALFVERARQLLADVEALQVDVEAVGGGHRGALRVGLFGSAAAELTPLVLGGYRRAFPDVRLELRELDMRNQVEEVLSGRVDVAFLRLPLDDDRLVVRPLFAEPVYTGVPAAHALAGATSASVAEILDERFAVDGAPGTWQSFWSLDAVRGAPCRPGTEVTSVWEAVLAVAHLGVVDTFPASACRRYRYPGVAYVELEDAPRATAATVSRAGDDRAVVNAFHRVAALTSELHLGVVPRAVPAARPATDDPAGLRNESAGEIARLRATIDEALAELVQLSARQAEPA